MPATTVSYQLYLYSLLNSITRVSAGKIDGEGKGTSEAFFLIS